MSSSIADLALSISSAPESRSSSASPDEATICSAASSSSSTVFSLAPTERISASAEATGAEREIMSRVDSLDAISSEAASSSAILLLTASSSVNFASMPAASAFLSTAAM